MNIKHIFTALFVTLLWGAAFAIIKIGLKGFPPIFNASLRFLFASIPLVFFIKKPQVSNRFLLMYGFNYVAMFSLMYVGMKFGMPSGLTSLILQSAVIFAAIQATFLLKDKPNTIQIFGIVLGVIGITIIGSDGSNFGSIASFIMILGAAFFYGISSIMMKMAGSTVNMFSLIVWGCLIPPIPLFLLSLLLESNHLEAILNIKFGGIFSILYTAYLGTILSFALWGNLLKKYSANKVIPFNLLVPVFGMTTSYILLKEPITLKTILASAIILTGVLFIVFEKHILKLKKKLQI